jgi:hypothetical protein
MRAELDGGFLNKTLRELLECWRDEVAPAHEGAM